MIRSVRAGACLLLFVLYGGVACGGEPIEHHLVDVRTIDPPLLEEIRYATRYNFTGETLYPFPRSFVHRDVAEALERVQRKLAKEGLGLKIFDGYRPLSVQRKMWDLIQDQRYVSNPAVNRGRHTRGTAVDVTLVDKLGNALAMPSEYDDFTDKAHRTYEGMTPDQRGNMLKLQEVMKQHGFVPYPFEWWHFDYRGWDRYPVLNISYEDLANGVNTAAPVE
jgi:D-alanyl-D-alanine dipeptidase